MIFGWPHTRFIRYVGNLEWVRCFICYIQERDVCFFNKEKLNGIEHGQFMCCRVGGSQSDIMSLNHKWNQTWYEIFSNLLMPLKWVFGCTSLLPSVFLGFNKWVIICKINFNHVTKLYYILKQISLGIVHHSSFLFYILATNKSILYHTLATNDFKNRFRIISPLVLLYVEHSLWP